MGRNIEIKARIEDPGFVFNKAREISDTDPQIINQVDTFFKCATGRLKLREFPEGNGELIFYNRQDSSGPKLSEYIRYETPNPRMLYDILKESNGILGVVRKERKLLIIGQTRIHIDHVENLGHFIELEVVLDNNETVEYGTEIADNLIRILEIKSENLIDSAYIDLLLD